MAETKRKRSWRWGTWGRLVLAGWRPGRDVWDSLKLPAGFTAFPEAQRVLAEFGGLKFTKPYGSATLDPSVGEEISEEIHAYEKKLGRALYPVGIIDGGDTLYLLLDESGLVYTLTYRLEPFASSFNQAIKYLVLVCTVNKREQREDLKSIGMFGKFWEKDSGP